MQSCSFSWTEWAKLQTCPVGEERRMLQSCMSGSGKISYLAFYCWSTEVQCRVYSGRRRGRGRGKPWVKLPLRGVPLCVLYIIWCFPDKSTKYLFYLFDADLFSLSYISLNVSSPTNLRDIVFIPTSFPWLRAAEWLSVSPCSKLVQNDSG